MRRAIASARPAAAAGSCTASPVPTPEHHRKSDSSIDAGRTSDASRQAVAVASASPTAGAAALGGKPILESAAAGRREEKLVRFRLASESTAGKETQQKMLTA
jgi:hypothetical protein